MDNKSHAFKQLKKIFPKLNDGVFVGLQILNILKNKQFEEQIIPIKLKAWRAFKSIARHFFGKKKSNTYEQLVKDLLKNYQKCAAEFHSKSIFTFIFKLFLYFLNT